ncbi:MAG: UvrD-helicase domain-containing protein [Candidatus Cloacimonetes bacterium]|nr:UvrD-helicase domain-containing protein [Candidatus Cloacimonadota bacterium]
MPDSIRKIITASAGTGKTYRLSLEYINLLLKYRKQNISYDEILVITFTRKATSEIRNAVIKHIESLLAQNEKGRELAENLDKLYGIKITENELAYLQNVYEQMLVNKHKLQISTIDSFVHTIFKAVIAPYIGIRDFQIDNEINKKYLQDIYNQIFSDEHDSASFIKIFQTAGRKTIEQYDNLILSIIHNRWLLQLIKDKGVEFRSDLQEFAHNSLLTFQSNFKELIIIIKEQFTLNNKLTEPAKSNFMSSYCKLLTTSDTEEFLDELELRISDESFLHKRRDTFSNELRFWKLQVVKDEIVKEKLDSVKSVAHQAFFNYFLYQYILPEEKALLSLADHILEEYDRLKIRDKILTYSDIAFYTFKYLYDPDLSLIDHDYGSVSNRFYEYLSSRVRFMLIDEFQDTGIIQHKLLFPIISEIISGSGIKEYGGVIVVGDEKQSIYGWRDGERELLLNMPAILQSNDSSSLNVTYRSSKFVTGFINKIFDKISNDLREENLFWDYNEIKANSKVREGLLSFNFQNKATGGIFEDLEQLNPYENFVENCLKPLLDEDKIDPTSSVILARDNTQLNEIAGVLEDNGIDYFLESSFSFLHHQSIKPIIHLLRYIAEKDILHFLRFLRSDFCLLPTHDLKDVIHLWKKAEKDNRIFIKLLKDNFSSHPFISKTVRLIEESLSCDIITLISRIIKDFNVIGIFPQEHNVKNLHLFLEVVSQFMSHNRLEYTKNLNGLLQYLVDNEKNEEFQQANIDQINSIQLMTVHKAKGLEFENVFFFYDISKRSGQDVGYINFLYQFNGSFTELEDYRITYNYSKVLKKMKYSLQIIQEKKDTLEELNNIYVALTRAKSNIVLYLVYTDKEGISQAIKPSKTETENENINIKKLYFKAIIDYLHDHNVDDLEEKSKCERYVKQEIGSIVASEHEVTKAKFPIGNSSELIKMQRENLLRKPDSQDNLSLNLKTLYLEDKHIIYGDLVHYYLSFVRNGEENELDYAHKRVMIKYGNLIPKEKILALIEKINGFIANNNDIFSKRWTKIFTEYTVFDEYNQEYRLDRLMIDEETKSMLIIDYKTGSIKDKEQLERYEHIVAELPSTKKERYLISSRYLIVDI